MKTTFTRFIPLCVSIMLFNLVIISTSSAEIDFEDCVVMLYLNEGAGDVVEDASGMDNNGKIHGGANWVNGKFGKALELDGSDDYVEIPHDDSLWVGEEHTIALWFKLANVPDGGMAVVTKDDWAPGFWWDGSVIRHHTHDPASSLHYIDAPWSPDTDWHHVAVTWDGEEFVVYLDAKKIGSGTNAKNIGRNPLSDKPFLIGIYLATGQHGQWGAFFPGIVDDVAIFKVALSVDDIDTIMNDGLEMTLSVDPSDKLATTWAKFKI